MPQVKLASNTVEVPDSELKLLRIMCQIGQAHGNEIVRSSNGSVTLPGIYKSLDRMQKRGLVIKTIKLTQVDGVTIKRAYYRLAKDLDCTPFQ